jgi:hypothetical protein
MPDKRYKNDSVAPAHAGATEFLLLFVQSREAGGGSGQNTKTNEVSV